MPSDFSRKIYQLRKERGMTLEEVGNIVGVGKSTVRKWETGMIANMRRDKISLLAKALGTTPAFLMGWDDNIDIKLMKENKSPSNESDLTEGEKELIKLFRLLPVEEQNLYLEMFRARLNARTKGQ
jgi:transcriptional regulator with XRE-family HTH domain